jgi:AbrB family looped-hinge helix DNA binding protein
MDSVTLSSKGQLVIPKAVRDRAQLSAGAVFSVRYEAGEIHLRPVSAPRVSTLEEVAGCLAQAGGEALNKEQVDAAIKARLKARNAP